MKPDIMPGDYRENPAEAASLLAYPMAQPPSAAKRSVSMKDFHAPGCLRAYMRVSAITQLAKNARGQVVGLQRNPVRIGSKDAAVGAMALVSLHPDRRTEQQLSFNANRLSQ
jgi:hypothetical protein